MKTYIFATDFSENARSALAYALPYIKKFKGRLILFHTYEYANPFVEAPAYVLPKMNQEIEIKANEQLMEWQQMVHDAHLDIPCNYLAEGGSFIQNLLKLSRKENPEAIFMGTKGASGLKRLIMGTNTASVIEEATCPIFVIPEEAKFAGISTIVFATDYQEKNIFILDQLAEIATGFEAKLEILHVTIEGVEMDLEVYDWYQKNVKKRLSNLEVTFRVVKKKSVHEGIDTYVKLNQPDLVVMAMREKTWLDRILKGSNSKRQAYITEKPLLVLHQEIRERV